MIDQLTTDEQAYFASGGESAIPAEETAQPAATQEETPAPPQDEAQPEETTAQDGDQPEIPAQEEGQPSHQVPLSRLKEEREKRKAAERQLQEMSDRTRLMEQRFNQMQILSAQQQAPQQPQRADIPDPEASPIDALRWTQQQLMESQARQAEFQRQQQERVTAATRQKQFQDQVVSTYAQLASEYRDENPHFDNAHDYVLQQRFGELIVSGASEQQARQQILQDEFQFVAGALQRRENPAAVIVRVAQARGWKAPVPATQPAHEKLGVVSQGQQANRSLSGAGTGANPAGKTTLSSVAEMTDKQFEDFLSKKGADGFAALFR